MKLNLSKPESFGRVEPVVFERLWERYHGEHKGAVLYPGLFTKVSRDNNEVLEALGSFVTDTVEYAQDTYKRLAKRAVFGADLTITRPGFQQRSVMWHNEGIRDGVSLLSVSALPTEFIVQKDTGRDVYEYIEWVPLKDGKITIFHEESLQKGVDDEVLEVYTPEPGEMIDLDYRIHCSPVNRTDELVKRVLLGCEITFRKR